MLASPYAFLRVNIVYQLSLTNNLFSFKILSHYVRTRIGTLVLRRYGSDDFEFTRIQ